MRNNVKLTVVALVTVLACAATMPAAVAEGNTATACQRSAGDMFSACKADVQNDLYTGHANCRHVADASDRKACFTEARQSRREEAKACRDVLHAREAACDLLGEFKYSDPLENQDSAFIHPDDIPGTYAPNPYVSLAAGHTYVLRAGEEGEETVVVHVTDDTREILNVPCRVVLDVVVEVDEEDEEVGYEAVEVTDDWFAQDETGNVYYCGEISRNYEDGLLRDTEGSFEAGMDFAKAGELIRAFPVAGDAHRQEFALGEAEDIVQYVDTMTAPGDDEGGDNAAFPCSEDMCLKTLEFAPLEPESSEFKYYLPGTGFVLAVALEDGEFSGEREELVCVGESLDVLDDPACEIADARALREELCALSAVLCE
jgi:hypothetical protein